MIVRKTNSDEEKRKLVCLEQLSADRQKLLMRWPFIGGVIMRMELIAVRDDRLETACTDGDRIFVDIDFYAKLKQDERLFVLAHEVWHSVLLHFLRKQNRDRELFNIAADLEIHFTLAEEKMKEPWVLPHKASWKNLSAEEIYEKLLEEEESQDENTDRASFDRHIYDGTPLDEPEKNQEKSGTGKTGSQGEPQQSDENNSPAKSGDEKNDSKGEFVTDDDYAPEISRDTEERVRGRAVAAAQQMERTIGKLPANIARLIAELQRPSLPWQEMLKQFVTSCYGGKRRWLPPSRRHVWQDLYLPSMRDERLNAVVALDTSGSTGRDMPLFLGELVSLMKSFGAFQLTVIQCDCKVHEVEQFSSDKLPASDHQWKIGGGGGTSFIPVFEYVKKEQLNPDLLLYFTDGFGDAPSTQPGYPVMWILTDDGKRPCSWGRAAKFKKQQ